MILLLNTFITPTPMNPYQRGFMGRDDNFETLLYMVSSLAAVNRWSHAIFRIKLDHHYAHRAAELECYIHQEFDPVCPRVEFTTWRNEYQHQWQEEVERLEDEPDPYIWFCCNHDHVFIDYDHEALDAALAALDADSEPRKAIYYSHWPECNRVLQNNFPQDFHLLPGGTILGRSIQMDSIQIVSKPLLWSWWFDRDFGNLYRPRSDWKEIHTCEPYRTIVPYREVCKHYDGYSHLFDIRTVPPLTIPPGFFERNIKLLFGAPENRPGWVNINPMRPYKTEHPEGVDYKWGCLEDIPLFWRGKITMVEKHPDADHIPLLDARNQAVREYITAPSTHPHLGSSMPPEEYIQKSLR